MEDWGVVSVALMSAAGFLGASLITIAGSEIVAGLRHYAAPVAAGVLLALAFGDVFPEAIAMAQTSAVLGAAGAFTLLYLIETFASAPEHAEAHAPADGGELATMLVGLAVHNAADGFAIGITSVLTGSAASLLGIGVLIHQFPVGLSFAAMLTALGMPRRRVALASLLMATLIPLATAVTLLVPVGGTRSTATLLGASAGLLLYIGAAHLLPEVHANRHNRGAALAFAATLLLMSVIAVTVIG